MRISDWSSDVCSSDLPGMIEQIAVVLIVFWRCALFLLALGGERVAQGGIYITNGGHVDTADCPSGLHIDSGPPAGSDNANKIGRAACRERVCQDVWITGVAVS